MTLRELHLRIRTQIFTKNDVVKVFPNEPKQQINTQLYRMKKRGDLIGIKRGVFVFTDAKIDEFVVANRLYIPSYVGLETVLNISSVIPDITTIVTSVTPVTSKQFSTSLGSFTYSKIGNALFFGYKNILDEQSGLYYNVASPEKSLLDYIYIRRVRNLTDSRIDFSSLDNELLSQYASHFPNWVRKVLENA